MNFKQLCTDSLKESDPAKAESMSRVTGGTYRFIGMDAKARRRVFQPFLEEEEQGAPIDWEFIDICWEQMLREFQYFALAYLFYRRNSLKKGDLARLKKLSAEKGGWDTGNLVQKLVNFLTARFPELEKDVVEWAKSDNPWLQRCALQHQLGRGSYLNTKSLEQMIDSCIGTNNRYVRKSIERSLLNCADDHPGFVRAILEKYPNELKRLAERGFLYEMDEED